MDKLLAKAEALDFSTDSDDEAWSFIFFYFLFSSLSFGIFQLNTLNFTGQPDRQQDRVTHLGEMHLIVGFNLLFIKELSFLGDWSGPGCLRNFFMKFR